MIHSVQMGGEIIKGVREVFSTMLMTELEAEEVGADIGRPIESNLTSMIGLAGGLQGVLAVHCPNSVAMTITSAFLGVSVETLNDDVKDAIGEIANIVAGSLKGACLAAGISVELAIPVSIVGESFQLNGMAEARRVLVALQMDGQPFWVELIYELHG